MYACWANRESAPRLGSSQRRRRIEACSLFRVAMLPREAERWVGVQLGRSRVTQDRSSRASVSLVPCV